MQDSILVIQVNEDSTKLFLAPANTISEEDLGTIRTAAKSDEQDEMTDLLADKFDEVKVPLRGQNISSVYQVTTF